MTATENLLTLDNAISSCRHDTPQLQPKKSFPNRMCICMSSTNYIPTIHINVHKYYTGIHVSRLILALIKGGSNK